MVARLVEVLGNQLGSGLDYSRPGLTTVGLGGESTRGRAGLWKSWAINCTRAWALVGLGSCGTGWKVNWMVARLMEGLSNQLGSGLYYSRLE